MGKGNNKQNDAPKVGKISVDELSEAMVRAHFRIQEKEKAQKRDEVKEWRESVGLEDDANNWAYGKLFGKMLLRPKKYMRKDMGVTMLMSMSITFSLLAFEVVMYVLGGILVFGIVLYAIQVQPVNAVVSFILSALFLLLGRLFRMARVEVEDIHDRQTVMGLFSALMSFFAVVLAIVAIAWNAV